MDPLFERMRALLPASVPVPKGSSASGLLKGLNRRFRIYRYREGSVYRPHVDGAWPSSSELPPSADGKIPAKYVYDADPSVRPGGPALLPWVPAGDSDRRLPPLPAALLALHVPVLPQRLVHARRDHLLCAVRPARRRP